MTNLIGIDPGLKTSGTGIAVFDEKGLIYNGSIHPDPRGSFFMRIREVLAYLKPLIKRGDEVIAEKSFYPGKANITHLKTLGAFETFFDCDYIAPATVKKLVAGHGRASKDDVKKAVLGMLEVKEQILVRIDDEDAVDAVAIALAWRIQNAQT